jgi:(4S)-4-hydroxy-5-phosphonooxypentane-2,3-dione isomerase
VYTVWVQLDVQPDRIDEFTDAIHANALASLHDEPGCLRFDVHADTTDLYRFYFYEIYVDREAFEVAHRGASHYARWVEAEAECIVPGSKTLLLSAPLFPDDVPEHP